MERSCRRLPSHPLKVCDFPRTSLLGISVNRKWASDAESPDPRDRGIVSVGWRVALPAPGEPTRAERGEHGYSCATSRQL